MANFNRRRRPTRMLEDLPGLFDSVQIDMTNAAEPSSTPHTPSRTPQKTTKKTKKATDDPLALDLDQIKPIHTLRFISFGSGSSGNCAYIGNDTCGFLIDAGVDNNRVIEELQRNGIDIDTVKGIILTHDHSDHVRFAYSILRRNTHMLLYCTPKNLNGLLRRHNISRRIKDYHKPIFKEFTFEIGPFKITPFETNHDGTDNMGFDIQLGDSHFVVATDLGEISPRADFYIRRANYLMLESNYDLAMLMRGPYPEHLKARIISTHGHLDNEVAAQYLAEIWTPQLTHVFLCHLSLDNNTPEIALATAHRALTLKGITIGDASDSFTARRAQLQLTTLPRFEASPLMIFRI